MELDLEYNRKADESHHISAKTVLSLAQRAQEIFDRSEPLEKQQLLKLVLQNPRLNGKNLEFELQKPFDTIGSVSGYPIELPELDAFRTLNWARIEWELNKYQLCLTMI